MQLFAHTSHTKSRSFKIGEGPSENGARLGGRAPNIDELEALKSEAKYVITVPFAINPMLYASVFINCDVDSLFDAMNAGIQSDDRIVVVTHGEVERLGKGTSFQSRLSEHPLIFEDVVKDDLVSTNDQLGRENFVSGHKAGGSPHFLQDPLEGFSSLLERGFVQVLQLDFPGQGEEVSGTWPFADGLFNLFMNPNNEDCPYWAFQK